VVFSGIPAAQFWVIRNQNSSTEIAQITKVCHSREGGNPAVVFFTRSNPYRHRATMDSRLRGNDSVGTRAFP
jgi:hypothetical protein